MYHIFQIHGDDFHWALDKLELNLAAVRTLDIHFSCFCPVGDINLRLNNFSLYAAKTLEDYAHRYPRRPSSSLSQIPPDWLRDRGPLGNAKHDWTTAMNRIQSLAGLVELKWHSKPALAPSPTSSGVDSYSTGRHGLISITTAVSPWKTTSWIFSSIIDASTDFSRSLPSHPAWQPALLNHIPAAACQSRRSANRWLKSSRIPRGTGRRGAAAGRTSMVCGGNRHTPPERC
ncbi:hypothetical protein N657DRAFT_275692 [Parathielavia appendiculata]|uniref:Uncharacterized protein n=1 Tax=Parathielavia appendiculata TaxID=2587402 RepID=A0AAN6U3E6_9PEZI|nr:hypothetical protein N657DRAFT_275692 [Parathielavia appendiculata]